MTRHGIAGIQKSRAKLLAGGRAHPDPQRAWNAGNAVIHKAHDQSRGPPLFVRPYPGWPNAVTDRASQMVECTRVGPILALQARRRDAMPIPEGKIICTDILGMGDHIVRIGNALVDTQTLRRTV